MAYRVKETYLTLQGEGAQVGRKAVFCRLSGCNLWSGKEADRKKAKCWFCDTDFVGTDGSGGGTFRTARELAAWIAKYWRESAEPRLVVFTGGEPLLQLDHALIEAVHAQGFQIAVETNGTCSAPAGIDWLTVSPKPNAELSLTSGDELKLVYPGVRDPKEFEQLKFKHFYLSPLWSNVRSELDANIEAAMAYCAEHPAWRLTLQLHKFLGIP